MHPEDRKCFEIPAINAHGVEVSMTIVERQKALFLYNGLSQQKLSLAPDCAWGDLEVEVKRLSGVVRLVLIPA
jgi:hypothetical protein